MPYRYSETSRMSRFGSNFDNVTEVKWKMHLFGNIIKYNHCSKILLQDIFQVFPEAMFYCK